MCDSCQDSQVLRYLMLQSCSLILPFKLPFKKLVSQKNRYESSQDHRLCTVHSICKTNSSIDIFIFSIKSTLDSQRFCTLCC